MKRLKNISDVRAFFHRDRTPTYFVSATPFNLLGMDEWVHDFTFINLIDCFDGKNSSVFVPREAPHPVFQSIEDINNYLLRHEDVRRLIEQKAPKQRGSRGNVVFLFFDQETERICKELGLRICFPSASLRSRLDNKLMTTRIANEARVRSVPNALVRITGYDRLKAVAKRNRLGDRLVVQTAFGDSGHTTFFIDDESDYRKHAAEIEAEKEVKVMKRLGVRGSALEACVTRHGTLAGPLMTELVGFKELTPYKGGWCGNEVVADAFPKKVRSFARKSAMRIGEALRKRRYKGYFELDFLTDRETGNVYLGEMNPRITGASSMTNLAAFAHADAPLFLFHLLEYAGIPYDLDVAEMNERWSNPAYIDSWSQLVMKHTGKDVAPITSAPRSGVWELSDDGSAHFVRDQTHRRTVRQENRAFFLRIANQGDWFYEGADLGILVTPGRLMRKDFRLTRRAKAWISGIRGEFKAGRGTRADREGVAETVELSGFKFL
jgi:D-alanine-D-alanine ligase-like ATP-grasp enzyme